MKLTEQEREAVMAMREEGHEVGPADIVREHEVPKVEDIGVEIFELVTNEDSTKTICNNCGWPVEAGLPYCPYCKEGLFWEKRG